MAERFPTTSTLDNFNRANEDPATGWTDGSGTGVEVISNTLGQDSAGSGAHYSTPATSADVEVWFQVTTKPDTNNEVIVNARRDDGPGGGSNTGYALWLVPQAGTDIVRVHDPADAQIVTTNQEVAVNDWLGMRIVGTLIEVWYRTNTGPWTMLTSVTDSSNDGSGNKKYFSVYLGDTLGTRIDNFGGGDYAPWSAETNADEKLRVVTGTGRW